MLSVYGGTAARLGDTFLILRLRFVDDYFCITVADWSRHHYKIKKSVAYVLTYGIISMIKFTIKSTAKVLNRTFLETSFE